MPASASSLDEPAVGAADVEPATWAAEKPDPLQPIPGGDRLHISAASVNSRYMPFRYDDAHDAVLRSTRITVGSGDLALGLTVHTTPESSRPDFSKRSRPTRDPQAGTWIFQLFGCRGAVGRARTVSSKADVCALQVCARLSARFKASPIWGRSRASLVGPV